MSFDEPDLSFSFTTSRPEPEKDESTSQRPSKSSTAAPNRLNTSTSKKSAAAASSSTSTSRSSHSTASNPNVTKIPSKASTAEEAEAREEELLNNTSTTSPIRSSAPQTSKRTPSKGKKKKEKLYLDADSEPENAEIESQGNPTFTDLPNATDAPSSSARHQDSKLPLQHVSSLPTSTTATEIDLQGNLNSSTRTSPKSSTHTEEAKNEQESDPFNASKASTRAKSSKTSAKTTKSTSSAKKSSIEPSSSADKTSSTLEQSSTHQDSYSPTDAHKMDVEGSSPKKNPKKRSSDVDDNTASPKRPKLKEGKAESSSTSKEARSSKSKAKDAKATDSKAVELEDNLVSYWDFVTEKRGETLLQKMKRDKKRRLTSEEEEMVRIVKNRFYAEAAAKYRPEDEIVANPIDEELKVAIQRYQRIIDLLERENAELEIIGHRARLQLEAEEEAVGTTGTSSSVSAAVAKSAPSTPGRPNRGTKSAPNSAKKTTAAQRRASLAPVETMDVSTPTESSVAQIFKSLPPGETLLSEEDRTFLSARPALGANLDLQLLSKLQTRFDALELLSRQIGFVNDTFEEKASATSAAMHSYMVPAGTSKINLTAMITSPSK